MIQQFLLNFKTKPEYNAIDFFVSSSNKNAYQWIRKWPNWPSSMISLYGPQGSGKTHLAHVWQEITHANFYSLSDLKNENIEDFFDNQMCLIIDNIDWEKHEKLLFHLYNIAKSKKGFVLIVSESSPETWNINLPDLKSRLNSIPKCRIDSPDKQLRQALIQKLFTDHQISLSEDIQNKILKLAPPTFVGTQNYVEKVCQLSFAEKKKISPTLIKKAKAA